ncbi:hypothetical protein KI809_00120 [Geobacter pelophilus]|jgi:DNA repair exonuclease SbcCD ATPase subunit|uniref:Lipoprotein n=1 Tax=Geoanaerobacter pelophilus TaxID=60036 RepID=A0AAW4L3S8_9BACT|nr:hypothetical protein [Geoanaerobacter pelophilus]MBT0662694.1 hypothetical protein [Geoanaerobacter pelophilus]
MKRISLCIAALLLLGGCTFIKDKLGYPREDKLAEAINQLEKGNETAAKNLLVDISNSRYSVEGVTDDALFRLSLLQLRRHNEAETMQSIQKRLTKLQTNFPDSQWSRLSWPLTEYITQMESSRNELKNLKQKYNSLLKENKELSLANQQMQSANQTLTKENKEINLRIEKLKSLDIELEKKNRR